MESIEAAENGSTETPAGKASGAAGDEHLSRQNSTGRADRSNQAAVIVKPQTDTVHTHETRTRTHTACKGTEHCRQIRNGNSTEQQTAESENRLKRRKMGLRPEGGGQDRQNRQNCREI